MTLNLAMRLGAVAGSAAWTPASLPSLQAWYDSDDASTFTYSSGSVVSQWNDKSGNARHLTQSTVSQQPSRSGAQNGKSTVLFDGVDDLMAVGSFGTITIPFTVVVMYEWQTVANDMRLFGFSGSSNIVQAFIASTNKLQMFNGGGLNTTANEVATTPRLRELAYNGASSAHYLNGAADGTGNPGSASASGQFTIASRGDGLLRGHLEMYEVVIVSGTISSGDRSSLTAYSQTKWGTP